MYSSRVSVWCFISLSTFLFEAIISNYCYWKLQYCRETLTKYLPTFKINCINIHSISFALFPFLYIECTEVLMQIAINCKTSFLSDGRHFKVCVYWCLTHIVFCFCFVFLRLCCSFLWIVHFWLYPWYSLAYYFFFIKTQVSIYHLLKLYIDFNRFILKEKKHRWL